ncbi:hypothetical protein B0T19DRAFT_419717 [Cercophora scortea]|uniref:Uncharacterized protein n=1 Tax=Cercophora scortea TaxID=314031 RepID=A0AAE0MIS3_9PEZI|nr:hypothetical protein B0T19DRAFT_419717 [Cercophora scortea]
MLKVVSTLPVSLPFIIWLVSHGIGHAVAVVLVSCGSDGDGGGWSGLAGMGWTGLVYGRERVCESLPLTRGCGRGGGRGRLEGERLSSIEWSALYLRCVHIICFAVCVCLFVRFSLT